MLLVQIRSASSWRILNQGNMGEQEKKETLKEYEEEENGALSHSQLPNKYLAELNMLLVSLSLISFSIDDCMEYKEREHNVRHQVAAAKTCISRPRLQTMNGDFHEPKLARRSSSTRFHTTIRDFRHGRKL